MNEINVLSLFDGMSCLQIALSELGIRVNKYYASEIDNHAVKLTKKLFPDMIHLGDVTKWREWDIDWKSIHIIGAGSPCQGFSFAGKQLAFDDPRSKLFFVFVEILEHVRKYNPDVIYLLENVRMKKEHENVISRILNIQPLNINSNLVSAQNRDRLYWTNIANEPFNLFGHVKCTIPQPKDRGILLKHVLESEVDEKYYLSEKMINYLNKRNEIFAKPNIRNLNKKASCITIGGEWKSGSDMNLVCVAQRGRNPENPKSRKAGLPTEQMLEPRFDGKTNCITSVQKDNLVLIGGIKDGIFQEGITSDFSQGARVYSPEGKSTCLSSEGGGMGAKTGLYAIKNTETLNEAYKEKLKIIEEYTCDCGNVFIGNIETPCPECGGFGGYANQLRIQEATQKGFVEIKPGECFDFENPNSTTRRGRKMEEKSNCLMAQSTSFMQFTTDFKIRRLTPRECGRLQTIPEHILDKMLNSGTSDTQLYRMFGNGWTVEVIKYILSFLPKYFLKQ